MDIIEDLYVYRKHYSKQYLVIQPSLSCIMPRYLVCQTVVESPISEIMGGFHIE